MTPRTALVLLFLLGLTGVATAQRTKIRKCPNTRMSGKFSVGDVQVTGCQKPGPNCIFRRGQNANMTLPFTVGTNTPDLVAKVEGIIGSLPIPFDLPNPDACCKGQSCTDALPCPLQPDTLYTYKKGLPVSNFYPSIALKVRWQLMGSKNDVVVCLEFPVKLQ